MWDGVGVGKAFESLQPTSLSATSQLQVALTAPASVHLWALTVPPREPVLPLDVSDWENSSVPCIVPGLFTSGFHTLHHIVLGKPESNLFFKNLMENE